MKTKLFKSKLQIGILIIGFVSLALGIKTMLQTPTIILPAPFLVLMFTPILIVFSLGFGFAIKKLSNSKWHTLTFTSIIISILCLTYFGLEHRPSYEITIPENYRGKVYLLESDKNDFSVNKRGIGYISTEILNEGFAYSIYQGDKEITDKINGLGSGKSTLRSFNGIHTISFILFEINPKEDDWKIVSIDELIEKGAVDTSRIKIKK